MAALVYLREQPKKWVYICFGRETLRQTYNHVTHTVDSKETWLAKEHLLSPDVSKQVGKKKK